MRREELVMDILGGLDDSFIEEAMPRIGKYAVSDSAAAAAPITLVETGTEISKKDLRIYWITRALGMAAVVAMIVGAVLVITGVWLLIVSLSQENSASYYTALKIIGLGAMLMGAKIVLKNLHLRKYIDGKKAKKTAKATMYIITARRRF